LYYKIHSKAKRGGIMGGLRWYVIIEYDPNTGKKPTAKSFGGWYPIGTTPDLEKEARQFASQAVLESGVINVHLWRVIP
jgi:hypothetical protein